jgi:hypothetical protein
MIWFLYHERNWENVKVSISRTYRAVSTGELLRSKYLCCQTPFCLHISLYHHFVNQLKPQALENTDERTSKFQWLFTITHRNTHEWSRTLNLYKLIVFHRSYKLMTLTKSSWFRPPYTIAVARHIQSLLANMEQVGGELCIGWILPKQCNMLAVMLIVFGFRCVQ